MLLEIAHFYHSPARIVECVSEYIRIYIFNFEKQTNNQQKKKQKKNKNIKKAKKAKAEKKKREYFRKIDQKNK